MTGSLVLPDPVPAATGQPLHVLTLTPFYPTALDEGRGCFVAEPLPLVSSLGIANTVLAVQPFYRPHAVANGHAFPAGQIRYISLPGGIGLPTAGWFLFANLLRIVRGLHRTNPVQVIHAHAALPCGHAAALLGKELKIPFAVTVHGLDAYSTVQVAGRAGRWCEQVSKFVYRSAARVICISEKVRNRVLEAGQTEVKTEVVYNGVDAEKFSPLAEGLSKKTILCVGDLKATKGQDLLLRAFADVHAEFPDFSCEIIGDGPERSALARTTSELHLDSKIRFRGRCSRPEVAKAMRRCTVFALPSTNEGLGCVYLEAMAAGKPAIGCRGQGIEEVIEHGASGWLVDPGSLDGLTKALRALLQNLQLCHQLGQAARRTILRDFTIERQAGRLAQSYRECAG